MDSRDTIELFAAFGPVSVRRMFGGAGIFAEGMMIGLVANGLIYLRADTHNEQDFEREGLGPFTYRTKNGTRALRYRRMPERLYDDGDELAHWARGALAAVQRGAAVKRRRSR